MTEQPGHCFRLKLSIQPLSFPSVQALPKDHFYKDQGISYLKICLILSKNGVVWFSFQVILAELLLQLCQGLASNTGWLQLSGLSSRSWLDQFSVRWCECLNSGSIHQIYFLLLALVTATKFADRLFHLIELHNLLWFGFQNNFVSRFP